MMILSGENEGSQKGQMTVTGELMGNTQKIEIKRLQIVDSLIEEDEDFDEDSPKEAGE